jgi:Zn-dependent M28 family amino/carboxypeptidase
MTEGLLMRRFTGLAASLGLLAASLVVVSPLSPSAGAAPLCNTTARLLQCVTLEGVRAHQQALQAISDANGGTRAAGTAGYEASVDYADSVFSSAGYIVTRQDFTFTNYRQLSPAVVQQVSPVPTDYIDGVDVATMEYSGSGEVTAAVKSVDLVLPPVGGSTSGCEAADFAGFPAGNIALIQRGTCDFSVKVLNAQAAGAVAVVIFNEGNSPDREGLIGATLGTTASVPVIEATFAVGAALAQEPGVVLHVKTETSNETLTSSNLFAESPGGNPDKTVMVGAHLDSVLEGPGINDNGSGVAAILETAKQLAGVTPKNKIRFALWGAEEAGLVGSTYYVDSLSTEQLGDIGLYLNFDMIGSPNYVRLVYDGDGSAFGLKAPNRSAAIEDFFTSFYASRGLASGEAVISFRSDYAAFFDAGIPFGGLFTGAEGIKTTEEAAIYGGTAGVAYDPCYHQACDTYNNNSNEVLDLNSDAVAAATLKYAMAKKLVSGPAVGAAKNQPNVGDSYVR